MWVFADHCRGSVPFAENRATHGSMIRVVSFRRSVKCVKCTDAESGTQGNRRIFESAAFRANWPTLENWTSFMKPPANPQFSIPRSRRQLLQGLGDGLGLAALGAMLKMDAASAAHSGRSASASDSRKSDHAAQATSVIEIFCPGGLSHVDTWSSKRRMGQRLMRSLVSRRLPELPGRTQKASGDFDSTGIVDDG